VTEVSQIVDVRAIDPLAALHRGKNSAVALAIAAGVADLELPDGVFD
jgi:hypothetical protein